MAYGDFKDLPRRIAADKLFRDKAFNTATNPRYGSYRRGIAPVVYNCFDFGRCC